MVIFSLNLYLKTHFNVQGGIIEVIPGVDKPNFKSFSINFFIDPCGEISTKGSYDKI